MAKSYDVVIIGAGPAGIFTALELADTGLSILILEKGLDIRERIALNRDRTAPAADRRANIVSGWGGAGAFSDGKLTLTTDYGGNLDDYMNKGELARLISYVDSVYCRFGGEGRQVYGDEQRDKIHELKRKAAAADLAFIPARIRHLGTDVNGEILTHMRDSFPSHVTVKANCPVDHILVKDGKVEGVIAGGETYLCKYLVAAPGRDGAEWFTKEAESLGLHTASNAVDIGVRGESPAEIYEPITDICYESKLVYFSKSFDDRVRTFCMNPYGFVVTENNNGLMTVNGHSYAHKKAAIRISPFSFPNSSPSPSTNPSNTASTLPPWPTCWAAAPSCSGWETCGTEGGPRQNVSAGAWCTPPCPLPHQEIYLWSCHIAS